MELRDHITNETSAFVERLVSAAEAAAQQVRLEAGARIAELGDEAQALRSRLEAEAARADSASRQLEAESARITSLTAQLDEESAHGATLSGQLDAESATSASLAAHLDEESARVAALTAQLAAESSSAASLMLRFETETAQAVALAADLEADRARATSLSAQLEAEGARAESLSTQLQAEGARVAALSAQLEAESARTVALAADLNALTEAHRHTDGERLQAESACEKTEEELRGLREMLQAARAEATRVANALEAEAAEKALMGEAHEEAIRALQAQAQAESQELRQEIEDAAKLRVRETAQGAGAVEQAGRIQTQLDAALLAVRTHQEQARSFEARMQAGEAAVASMRKEADDANALSDATCAELSVMRDRMRRLTAMANSAATSLDALGSATTVADIFRTLVTQLSTEFQRVAIFRVKGNHLEGELAAGVDSSVDITKIVIPIGLSSVITKAAASGSLEHATKEQIVDSRPPFGGAPASALAAALVFQGERLAVAYADSDAPFSDAHGAFAGVLVRHANALLAHLTHELKAARQLREYAQMLLHEAEQMFLADLQAGIPAPDRVRRLRDSIGCARQLYTQHAALEGPLSADLLNEEITAISEVEPVTAFARDLAIVVAQPEAQRNAS